MFPASLQTNRLQFRPIAAGDARAIFDAYAQDAQDRLHWVRNGAWIIRLKLYSLACQVQEGAND
jgi:hypothetical protein